MRKQKFNADESTTGGGRGTIVKTKKAVVGKVDRVKAARKAMKSDDEDEDDEPVKVSKKKVKAKRIEHDEDEDERPAKKGSTVRGKSRQSKERRRVKEQEAKTDEKIDRRSKASEKKVAKKKSKSERLSRHMQGHLVDEVMKKGPINIKTIAEQTGLSLARVQGHVEYRIGLGQASMDKKGRVILSDEKEIHYRKS